MKKIIQSAWCGWSLDENKLARALLQYRNTPSHKDGLAPAQKLYGQLIQDTLPAHRRAFSPEWQCSTSMAEKQAQTTTENVVKSYNSKARPLPEIKIGSRVALQNHEAKRWDIYGTVTDIGPHRVAGSWFTIEDSCIVASHHQFLHLLLNSCSKQTKPIDRRNCHL